MYVIVGKYVVYMEETGLVHTHPTGISLHPTPDEVVGLMSFIKVYWDAVAAARRDTEPRIERIAMDSLKARNGQAQAP